MQLQDWARMAPPEERAARDKAVTRLLASLNTGPNLHTDCVDLSGLKLTSLPRYLSSLKIKVLILEGNLLEELPELPPGLTTLSAPGNQLSGLPKLPTGLKTLDVSDNNLTAIPNLPPHAWHASSIGKFEADLRGNLFSDRDLRAMHDRLKASESGSTKHAPLQFDAPPALPTAVLEAWISNAEPHEQASRMEAAIRIANAHETNALSLTLSGLGLTDLPDCLSQLDVAELHLQDNKLGSVPGLPLPALPHGLIALRAHNNMLTTLPLLPRTLTNLNVENNFLSKLPGLPPGLKMLHASDNHLEKLGELPATLQVLTVAGNNLASLPTLPEALIGLNVKDNRLTQIPDLPDAAWSKAEHTYFMADLRDNQFSAADLRAFQARLDSTFEPDANARLRFRIEAPAPVLLLPCPVVLIKTRDDAKAEVKYWSDQGVPHEALVALRADLDTYMLHAKITGDVFDARYGIGISDTRLPGKFFNEHSKIQDADLRKNFAYLRMALPIR